MLTHAPAAPLVLVEIDSPEKERSSQNAMFKLRIGIMPDVLWIRCDKT